MNTAKKQFAMVVDSSRCIDCKGCMASCKVANDVPDGFWRNWIKQNEPDFVQGPRKDTLGKQHFQPGGCMHCDEPLCVTACPSGATYKDKETGIVEIDQSLCIGCGNCIQACPYGARYRHPKLKVADKCNYCPQRRVRGLAPACVDTCPTKARVFGDINDPESEAARLLAENKDRTLKVVNLRTDTKPNMYYLGETGPTDWPVEASVPTPISLMFGALTPALKAAVALSGLGIAAMAVKQVVAGSSHPEEDKE